MKLVGKVPVEPLDDERLTNIERNLVVAVSDMKAPASPFSRRVLAVAAFAFAIALAGFVGWKLHREPTVTAPTPQTFAMKSETDRATLDLGDAQLASAPGTDVNIERVPSKTSIVMATGTLDLVVDHKPGRLFVVHAGDTEIEDVGTKFSVVFDGKSHVEVRVTEGEVRVRRGGKDFSVTANNAWTTELGTTTIAQLDATATSVVVAHNDDVVIDPPVVEPPVVEPARGSGAGSGSAAKRPRKGGIKDAILAVPLNPMPGSISELTEYLNGNEDRSRVHYSIAVAHHLAKNDERALYFLQGPIQQTNSAAHKDAMWLIVRIRCLKALDDSCRVAAGRYLNNIESGVAAGVAQEILKQIAL